ncbi:MAG: hypothetical protein ABIG20_02835 [archaeon]
MNKEEEKLLKTRLEYIHEQYRETPFSPEDFRLKLRGVIGWAYFDDVRNRKKTYAAFLADYVEKGWLKKYKKKYMLTAESLEFLGLIGLKKSRQKTEAGAQGAEEENKYTKTEVIEIVMQTLFDSSEGDWFNGLQFNKTVSKLYKTPGFTPSMKKRIGGIKTLSTFLLEKEYIVMRKLANTRARYRINRRKWQPKNEKS